IEYVIGRPLTSTPPHMQRRQHMFAPPGFMVTAMPPVQMRARTQGEERETTEADETGTNISMSSKKSKKPTRDEDDS
ncbi:hypothetical protein PFISCL1PPCAC_13289, partial [Pristionchus fissidentatus]